MSQDATIQDIKNILTEIVKQSKNSKEELDELKKENEERAKIAQQELEVLKKENEERAKIAQQEIEALKKETEEETKASQKAFKELSKEIKKAQNLFTTQWGRLIESLVEGELINLFKEKGLKIDSISTRRKGASNGQAFEFDIIVHNTTEIVIVEVKTTLKVADVDKHIDKLQKAKSWLKEYKNHNIQGAVAFLKADETSDTFAEKNGLWVIKATGNSASIVNMENFQPIIF